MSDTHSVALPPMTVLWSFSYHIFGVDFWPVCLHWSDQRSLILKSFLRYDYKLSMGQIQTRHTNFLPLHVCGRLWRGCRFGVQNCLIQLIAFRDLKYPSSSSFKPNLVDFRLVCIIFIGSEFIDPETCPRVWLQIVYGLYPNRTYWFSSPAGLWKVMTTVLVLIILHVSINTLIGFKTVPQVIQVCSCVVKGFPKGHHGPLG